MRIFTWHDIETEIDKNRKNWAVAWNRVDVYHDEIVVNVDVGLNNSEENKRAFEKIFPSLYDGENVVVEFDGSKLKIVYEDGDDSDKSSRMKAPLFKDMYIQDGKGAAVLDDFGGVPIVAFHSYKGGVGRTLSLIALARECAEKHGDNKKILIIDADMEAPGLTWMLESENHNAPISYLDILSLMHFNEMNNSLAEEIVKLIKRSTVTIETTKLQTEHYFIPVYREKEQLMHIFSSPEKIINTQSNKYAITEFISLIGKALGAEMILVDLRAGVTEFSAPFLFDPRVTKFFITSTSKQSIKGLQLILDEVYQKTSDSLLRSKILLTMVPPEMEEQKKLRLESELVKNIEAAADEQETTFLREEYLFRVPFESPFISLGNFNDICELLKGKQLSKIMEEIVGDLFKSEVSECDFAVGEIQDSLVKLNQLLSSEITAEGNASANMLSTASIREMVKNHKETLPRIVVLGAKGSGKTYAYKQMLTLGSWEAFETLVEQRKDSQVPKTLFFPLLTTVNAGYLDSKISECIENLNRHFGENKISLSVVNENRTMLSDCMAKDIDLRQWTDCWIKLMVKSIDNTFDNLTDLDDFLEGKQKKIIFLIDGLEDVFLAADSNNWRNGLRVLCQNLINEIRTPNYKNIGIIAFVRKDMAEDAIEINFEQFKNQYAKYELNWTQTEALRLALWLAAKTIPSLADGIDILKATRGVIEERLEVLWGKKLGKYDSREAFSARWIIVALSDFNGQLQARDIVRFLYYATGSSEEARFIYKDRYIMPSAIKESIEKCSNDKLKEISDEMKAIHSILKKFNNMDNREKQLPLVLDKISLTGDEIARLENQGYLKISDKKYYLPEIIRYALGFKYEKGARPKVLSLLMR